MMNALTIDVEDYYSVFRRDRLGGEAPPTDAVVRCTGRVLGLLGDRGVKATFFVLGEVARSFPQLIRDIAAAGHEIGVHGFYHRQVFKLTRQGFRRELGDAKKLVEDITGHGVEGHRAPAFSIRQETKWALEVLAELGFRYDSSVVPFKGRRYGWPGFGEDIRQVPLPGGASIIEAPITAIGILGRGIPACGGGYLRHFPYWFTRWAFRRSRHARPVIAYIHPYELDTDSPPADFAKILAAGPKAARKHHASQLRNRSTVERKLTRLLGEFRFAPLREVIDSVLGGHDGWAINDPPPNQSASTFQPDRPIVLDAAGGLFLKRTEGICVSG